MLCYSVSNTRSMQLQCCPPDIISSYRPVASDYFEQYQYPTCRHTGQGICYCGFEHSATHYSSLNGRSCRWTATADGWHRTGRPSDLQLHVANVANPCCSSYNTCNYFGAFMRDHHCCQSSVKRHARFFSELPAYRHCQCCGVIPGLCKSLCVTLACVDV